MDIKQPKGSRMTPDEAVRRKTGSKVVRSDPNLIRATSFGEISNPFDAVIVRFLKHF